MNPKVFAIVDGVRRSADHDPSRCPYCVYDFTDADGFHQLCREDRRNSVGKGCDLLQPCGIAMFHRIQQSPYKVRVATLVFDAKMQANTMTGTMAVTGVASIVERHWGLKSFQVKESDPWTDPVYQLNKMNWMIHRDTGFWMMFEIRNGTYVLYAEAGYRKRLYEAFREYYLEEKIQFFKVAG
jgi:hypothetical protein